MAWTLAQARTYLGLGAPPGAEDALIQLILDETLVAVEGVLGRKLFFARIPETFYHVTSSTLLLSRFPLTTVYAIDKVGVDPAGAAFGGGTDNLVIHLSGGWLRSPLFVGCSQITVDYEGGYVDLPVDLEQVMWSAFLTRYGDRDAVTGAPPVAGQGTVVAGSGEVSSITLADFGTIKYDVGSTVTSAELTAAATEKYGWLAPWAGTWDRHRAGQAGAGLGVV